jgi:hypothetical protein
MAKIRVAACNLKNRIDILQKFVRTGKLLVETLRSVDPSSASRLGGQTGLRVKVKKPESEKSKDEVRSHPIWPGWFKNAIPVRD